MSDAPAMTVLVVDDNPPMRYSTSRILKSAGFKVLEAGTGFEALSLAAQFPDLVVLDVNLPDIDGFQVCRELRSIPELARTPVIHLSATFVSDDYKIRGLEAGADGYLTHPVEPLVLIATLNAFLRTRQAEEKMRQSDARLRAIFDHAQNGICLLTQEFLFLEANPAMSQMLGFPRSELLGKNLRSLISSANTERVNVIIRQLQREGSWTGSFPLMTATGQQIELDWRLSVHSDPGQWLAILTDATERIRVETEREQLLNRERTARATAERANRIKDDFLATLSHELRTPLSAIVGWAQVLKFGRDIDPKDFMEGVEAIERNAKIQTQLIEDLLDVSRITSGKLLLEIQPVDVGTLVIKSLESLMPVAKIKAIEIVKIVDLNAGIAHADPSRLQQIISNLVGNALKFSHKGGKIFVKVQRVESSIELAVIDQGQGIAPEFLPHIFERFRQQDASTTRSHGGLGLGLAIVKHLVEAQGGSVHASSEGLNKGSQFIVRLPVALNVQPRVAASDDRISHNTASVPSYLTAGVIRGARVLLIDDDDDTRILLRRLLQDCGAEVTMASNVRQALEIVVRVPLDMVISDIGMPDESGYDMIYKLRKLGYDSHKLPAIALTAFARGEDRNHAIDAGFQMHLEKPIDPSELIAAIASLLGKPPAAIE